MTAPAGGRHEHHGEPRARTHNRARRIGYALLPGEGFSYLLHLRPREWPIVAAHLSVGYVLAAGWPSAGWREWAGPLGAAIAIWVLFLNGGTLALNSAFDHDIGDIGYLDAPPVPPNGLAIFGATLMAIGQALAVSLPSGFSLSYATCFAMSVVYSVPPVRLKAVAGADWLVNMVGFGALTTYAGWAATGRPITPAMIWIVAAFFALFAALYPLTQLYQLEEDRDRGDRTLALVLGVRASLVVALLAALVAFASFAAAVGAGGISPLRWAPLAGAGVLWIGLLARWFVRAPGMSPSEHHRGMYTALGVWALTDAAVVWGFVGLPRT